MCLSGASAVKRAVVKLFKSMYYKFKEPPAKKATSNVGDNVGIESTSRQIEPTWVY